MRTLQTNAQTHDTLWGLYLFEQLCGVQYQRCFFKKQLYSVKRLQFNEGISFQGCIMFCGVAFYGLVTFWH